MPILAQVARSCLKTFLCILPRDLGKWLVISRKQLAYALILVCCPLVNADWGEGHFCVDLHLKVKVRRVYRYTVVEDW